MKTHRFFNSVSAILFGAWLVVGCAHPRQTASARDLYAKIQIGMTRSEVDTLLGTPTIRQLSFDDDAWYCPHRALSFTSHLPLLALSAFDLPLTAELHRSV